MSIKVAMGRLTMADYLESWVPRLHREWGDHSDPFDRMLIAQAQCENLTLVTADAARDAYDVRTINTRI